MPLSAIQTNVLRRIAANRSPDSFVAGADDTHLPLGALAWAACGKDPGYTPEFLLEQAARHVAYTQDDLDRLAPREPLDLRDLKRRWVAAMGRARTLVAALPPDEIGCLYVGPDGHPVAPDPASDGFRSLVRHRGCVRGAWPSISPYRHG